MKPHICSTLFCDFVLILPHPFSTVTTISQLFAALLFSGHLFNSSQFLHLFTPQLNSFHLFPALLNSSQRLSPLPTSFQLFSTRLNSSHFRSIHLTSFSANLNFSRSLSTLLNSCQLSPPFHRDALHSEFVTHRSLLHTETFAQRSFYTHFFTFFYTQQVFTQRNLHTHHVFTQRNFHTEHLLLNLFLDAKASADTLLDLCVLHIKVNSKQQLYICYWSWNTNGVNWFHPASAHTFSECRMIQK